MGRPFFRPAHRDASEPAIIKALRAVGASVWPISGKDVPDLLVGFKGQTWLLECKSRLSNTKKDGYTRKTTTKVSEGQQAFQDSWRGGPVRVVHTPEEALYAIGVPVEGVLEPLTPRVLKCRECEFETVSPELAKGHANAKGHCVDRLVTPAYQREQTAAVVPPKKKRKAKRRPCPAGVACTHPWCHTGPQPVDFEEGPDRPNPED